MRLATVMTLAATLMLALPALADPPIIDGRADDVLYGDPLMIQDTETGYGDANRGRPDFANGSEMDQVFAKVYNGVLYMVFAGNFEDNGNRLNIFFDTITGGQNQLVLENPDIDALQRMGPNPDDPVGEPGLKFKSGFAADFWLSVNCSGDPPDPVTVYADYARLWVSEGDPGEGYYLGSTGTVCEGLGGVLTGGDVGAPDDILVNLDNSNTLGVIGGFSVGDGSGVTTGFEICIPLARLGNPTGNIKVTAFISSGDGAAVSNQVAGPIAAFHAGNLAGGAGNELVPDVRLLDFGDSAIIPHAPLSFPSTATVVGACCIGGDCQVLTPAACAGAGGDYQGDNEPCYGDYPCGGPPVGQCCIDDGLSGQCMMLTEADCDAEGGTWDGMGTCDGCPCLLPPKGACCFTDSCGDDYTEQDCLDAGGEYAGDFSTCDSDPCQFGIATPHLIGPWAGWDPTNPAYLMTDNGDGTFEYTLTDADPGMAPDSFYNFKITDGTGWGGSFPGADSWLYSDGDSSCTVTYNTNIIEDGWSPNIFRLQLTTDPGTWTAAGNFQSEVGGSDWDNGSLVTAMVHQGGGIYLYENTGLTAGTWQWKAVVTGSWSSISWDGRSVNTQNMSFEIGSEADVFQLWVDSFNGVVKVVIIPPVDICVGDCNCDGIIDLRDINPFALGLAQPDSQCEPGNFDINGDEIVDLRDINPFVNLLSTGGIPIDCNE